MTPVSLQPTFLVFTSLFDSMKWPYYQKYVNQITESHNSLKLVFTNTGGLGSNFVGFQFSLESNSLDICVLCEANYEDSVVSRNFFCMVHVPLVGKDSVTHMHGREVYVKERLSFTWDISEENSEYSYFCF